MSRRFDRNRQFSVNDQLPYIANTNDAPVELTRLDVRVHVTGLFAETTQILTLHNPNARDLEGELVFPLPDDGVVCGYGIDVGGRLVDGVVVEKEEARRILEAEIRKGVDPGLIEQVQGNLYRTRIYPLPAGGSRTVKIVYISRLDTDGNDAAYHLPLGHAAGVDHVSLRIEVSQTPVEPAIVGGLGNLALGEFENRWVAEAEVADADASDDVLVRLPGIPTHLTAVERFAEDDFFCISSNVEGRSPSTSEWNPSRVALLWDASGSRTKVERELALLEALGENWQNVTFDVCVVRDVVDPPRVFEVAGGNTAELCMFLRDLAYDGATRLASIDLAVTPHADDEAWLVFSDGLNTIGEGVPTGTSPRVFAFSSQPKCDSALLNLVAQRSGGAYFNLLTRDPSNAADAVANWSDALRLERTAGCEDVHVFSDDGRLTIVGRLTEAIGSVFLTGPGAPDDQLSVARDTATNGRNLARAWAGKEAQLAKMRGERPERIVELGRTYGLVTPGTSLLVLETLEQHLEHDIEPPPTRPALREQFLAQRRSVREDESERERRQIESVVSMWQRRVEWWETDFRARHKEELLAAKGQLDDEEVAMSMDLAAEPEGAPPPMASQAAPEPMMRSRVMRREAPVEELSALDEVADAGFGGEGAPGGAAKKKEGASGARASIKIQPWSADAPYLSDMRSAQDAYASYLESRAQYAASPAFFLDCADFLLNTGERERGLRVLSNLLELALDDPALLRMYAWRMQQARELDAAIDVLERVRRMRDDEPQSHRDLALALELRWQRDGNVEDATRAMKLLYAVVKRTWDRFPEIEIIALMELNRLIHLAEQAGIERPAEIDERLVRRLDLDVRISMSWDADLTDVDLHLFEPTGEHAYYGHNRTAIGGLVSRDFTQGYGPEEYVLRHAVPGEYTIKTHYYGSHQQTVTGACTVIVNVFTNYARSDEERQVLTLRLERASDQVLVGTITIDP